MQLVFIISKKNKQKPQQSITLKEKLLCLNKRMSLKLLVAQAVHCVGTMLLGQ